MGPRGGSAARGDGHRVLLAGVQSLLDGDAELPSAFEAELAAGEDD